MISENIFQFWRVVVSAAHADHIITQKEHDFITKKFDYICFSEQQKSQLLSELDSAQDPVTIFNAIEPAEKRAECLYMLHNLVHVDDEFHPLEEKLYKALKGDQMNSLDTEAIEEDFKTFLYEQTNRKGALEEYLVEYRDEFDFLSGLKKWFKS